VDVRVVLAEQIGEGPMVVEMEFERVFGGWLRNGFAKPRKIYSRRRPRTGSTDRSAFRIHF